MAIINRTPDWLDDERATKARRQSVRREGASVYLVPARHRALGVPQAFQGHQDLEPRAVG
jgi:hypothetical protein